MKVKIFSLFIVVLFSFQDLTIAQSSRVLSVKDQATLIDDLLEDRLQNLLPVLMREQGIDMWVIVSREYNEDPVMRTMLPSTWLNARRRTIFVFWDDGVEVHRQAIARYDVGRLLVGAWNLNAHPHQWDALVSIIEKVNPDKIALNFSKYYAHADGLSYTAWQELNEVLPMEYKKRIVSAATLAVRWLETRTPKEMTIYEQLGRISHEIIAEAFSEKVIQPGFTTTEDVVWWMRQKLVDLGLNTWFHPTVDVQREGSINNDHLRSFSMGYKTEVIRPGDLLHCDFGIAYLRLNTDQQQHAYVLKPGEQEVPEYLVKALEQGNRVQEILTDNFITGMSGNEILANTLEQVKLEGIEGTIYTHPIGYHGHAAGPTIGMWDNQGKTVGSGDYTLRPNTTYSIELNASVRIKEWAKSIRIMLEEDGYFDGENFRYIDGRQLKIYTIPRQR